MVLQVSKTICTVERRMGWLSNTCIYYLVGLGCGLAMYAPFRIITEKTKYAMPETAVGIFCDALCSYYLSRLDGYLGKYLTMTGSIINGEDVL
jgi:3-hydroxyisobutyryl-CoA hydrolase